MIIERTSRLATRYATKRNTIAVIEMSTTPRVSSSTWTPDRPPRAGAGGASLTGDRGEGTSAIAGVS